MTKVQLGQNFLIDEAWQKKIVDYFQPAHGFGEIGPGYGALTYHLEKRNPEFVVFEIDPKIIEVHLDKPYDVIEGSFLDWDYSLKGKAVFDFSLIGNLPYESGSLMLTKIADKSEQIEMFVFLLQKEVVERICASTHCRDFASFTVLMQGQYDLEALDIIAPEFFNPPPKVQSQIVRGIRRKEGRHSLDRKYLKFLKASFLNKRKTLRNSWKSLYSKELLDKVYDKYAFNSFQRAEEIEVDLWPKLFQDLTNG